MSNSLEIAIKKHNEIILKDKFRRMLDDIRWQNHLAKWERTLERLEKLEKKKITNQRDNLNDLKGEDDALHIDLTFYISQARNEGLEPSEEEELNDILSEVEKEIVIDEQGNEYLTRLYISSRTTSDCDFYENNFKRICRYSSEGYEEMLKFFKETDKELREEEKRLNLNSQNNLIIFQYDGTPIYRTPKEQVGNLENIKVLSNKENKFIKVAGEDKTKDKIEIFHLSNYQLEKDFEELVRLYAYRGVPREQLEKTRKLLTEKSKIERKLNELRQLKNKKVKGGDKFFYQMPQALEKAKEIETDEKKLKIIKEIEELYWWKTEGFEPTEEEISRAEQIVSNDKQQKKELKQKYEEILQEIKNKEEKANPDNEEDRQKQLWSEVQRLEGEAYFIKTYQLKIEEEEKCPECGRKVAVDEDTGVCKRCAKQIEEECGNILETQEETESGICEECAEKTEDETKKKECSDCGEELESEKEVEMGVCYDCTAKLIETEPECSECGETLITDEEIKRGICDDFGQSELTREEELDFNLLEFEYDDEEERKENREKIKVTFAEPLVKEKTEYTGIFLPLDLAGDVKKINTEPTTSK
ncbi:17228_t:CDS:10 [Racocetra fulgida]|uniref:17228_t:CDS:1 n=1 Tax=Racocetra fulgida TaxID=60492 RepID=A0A9N8YS99_9GLOM|nr:17228_t:CDS:10 [Racocetra fulgida]